MQNHARKQKIIQPGFQLRLVGMFTGIGTLALLLQFMIVGFLLTNAAGAAESEGGNVADTLPSVLLKTLLFSLGMLVPVIFGFGILLTFRIAGPAHRMEGWLRAIVRGEDQGECKIRKGDQLQDLCNAMNQAVSKLREEAGQDRTASSEETEEAWTTAA